MDIKKFIVLITCVLHVVWGYPENNLQTLSKSQRGGRIIGAKIFRKYTLYHFTEFYFIYKGGSDAVKGQFPFQCAIYIFTSNEKGSTFCSGSIISENFVLTAAHCFEDMISGLIIAGVVNLQNESPPYDYDIERENIINHKDFDPLEYINDIALVDLSDYPFNFAHIAINKIQLGSLTFQNLVGQQARIAGW
jgi:hypothetical protein